MTHVYLFSPIPYTFLPQRPQKLAAQFMDRGIAVTYIEPCGLREYLAGHRKGLPGLLLASVWYQFRALLGAVFPSWIRRSRGRPSGQTRAQGVSILTMPLIVPHTRFDSGFVEKMNAVIYRGVLDHKVFSRMEEGEQSIAIVENPYWGLVLKEGDFSVLAYDCLDEMVLFAGRSSVARYADYERRLLDIARVTFVTAEQLEDDLRRKGAHTPLVRIPNGVDYEWFQDRAAGGNPPEDLAAIRTPVAGYVGVLRAWFDYELIGRLATSMPDISFVIVGPLDISGKIGTLRGIPNLFWLGRRPYGDVPRYIRGFDVCLIPFISGRVTMTTNPVKVYEYFALGKPVVSTPLNEVVKYGREGLLRIATGERDFGSAIRASIVEREEGLADRRRDVARNHSWTALAGLMLSNLTAGTQP